MNKTAIVIIGTKKYFNFGIDLVHSMNKNLIGNYDIIFLTEKNNIENVKQSNLLFFEIPLEPWPFPTLKRFHYILNYKTQLTKYSHMLYIDSDMKFVSNVNLDDEMLSDRVVVKHQMMYDLNADDFSFERDLNSTAGVDKQIKPNFYYQNNVFGGKTELVLEMCSILSKNIDTDLKNSIIAKWWDESHANKYYINNPPTKILSLEYNCPEDRCLSNKKLIHIMKNNSTVRI